MKMNPIPYGRQSIQEEDIQAVCNVLNDDFLTQGPRIEAFEEAFAAYVGSAYAVAVSNGTAALHLCVLALALKSGQKVLCSPMTFVASVNCVKYAGGMVDFVDIDPRTGLMDLNALERKLAYANADDFLGIIPVDYMGAAVDLEKTRHIADKYGCWIIEDACHAPGGFFTDSKEIRQHCGNGAYADLAIFSFHPVKHIACGEGGMITTNNPYLYERLRLLRNHGITKNPSQLTATPTESSRSDPSPFEHNIPRGGWYYEMQELGFNYRLSDIHASLGLSQLKRAREGLARRRHLARQYDEAFVNSTVIIPPSSEGHAYHLYVIRTPKRKELYDHLRKHQIYTQVHYIPVHYQPYYQQLGWKAGDFPHTEKWYQHCLSLPMYPTLSDSEQQYVIDRVLECVS